MPTNHGSIEFLKFPNPAYITDNTQPRFIKKWLRDSWARRKILALQQAIAGIIVPIASTANPQMDGTAAPGVSTDYARADHTHPHDTSKADAATTYTKTEVNNLIPSVPSASTANPAMDGTASPGSSTAWARGDHVHPSDTAKQDALTPAQLEAVNSGVTAAKVQTWDNIIVPTKTSDLTNDSGFITAGKFAVVDGTLPSAGGFGTEMSYPTGFTSTNCVILSVSAYVFSEWRGGVGIVAASERLWCDLTATGIKPFISANSAFYGATVRVVLMRTDI